MRFSIHFLLSLGVLVCSFLESRSEGVQDTTWVSVKKTADMEIFTRDGVQIQVKEIKIELVVPGTLSLVKEVLGDVPGYLNWVYKCTESIRLKTVSDNEFHYYILSDFPFPFSDRELMVHSKQYINEEGVYHSHSVVSNEFVVENPDIVRVPIFESYWKIKPLSSNLLQIDYRVSSSPGGAIPLWLVNLAITVGPYETMKSFREMLEARMAASGL